MYNVSNSEYFRTVTKIEKRLLATAENAKVMGPLKSLALPASGFGVQMPVYSIRVFTFIQPPHPFLEQNTGHRKRF